MPPQKHTSIHATSRQTRFHIVENANSKEIDLHTVNISIGKTEILSDAHLKLASGVHYVLVGRNGVGKSTLLRSLYDKTIPGLSKDLRILLLQQSYGAEHHITDEEDAKLSVLQCVVKSDKDLAEALRKSAMLREVLENQTNSVAISKVVKLLKHETRLAELEEAIKMAMLRSGARGLKARKELRALEEEVEVEKSKLSVHEYDSISETETDEAINMLTELDLALENMSASTAEARAEALLVGLGFSKDFIKKPMSDLSGGWRTRTILASLLFQPSDVLLLDEPTNFLDMASLLWLENHIKERDTTIVLVSHDRAFVDAVAHEIIILRDKKLERFRGNLSAYEQVRKENKQRLTKMKEAQDKQVAHMEETIAGNIRAAKAAGDDKKLKQAASRQKKLDERMGYQVGIRGGKFKLNRDFPIYHTNMRADIEIPMDDLEARLALIKISPLSDLYFPGPLLSCEALSIGYHLSNTILENINLTIHMKDRIALVGLNGAGKSSLVAALVNQVSFSGRIKGSVSQHPRGRIGYFSQEAVDLLPTAPTALQYMAGHSESLSHAQDQELRGILSSFGLSGRVVSDVPLSLLSGGQKVRVVLAKVLTPPPHLLVLDEVTTHLDADSIVALADELRYYPGAVLVVSHDRWFIKRVVEEEEEGSEGGGDDSGYGEGVRRVYMVGGGRIELLSGVDQFEKKIRKKNHNSIR